jgi:signal transduction histidine kinase
MNDAFVNRANLLLSRALLHHEAQAVIDDTLLEAVQSTSSLRSFVAGIDPATGLMEVVAAQGRDWSPRDKDSRLAVHNTTQCGITAWAAITSQPYVAQNVQSDTHYVRHFDDVMSESALPILDSEGLVQAVLNVQSSKIAWYTPERVAMLQMLANVVGAALVTQTFVRRERALGQIGLELAAASSRDHLTRKVLDLVVSTLHCQACSLFLMDETRTRLILHSARGSLQEQVGEATYEIGDGLTGTVASTGKPIRLEDPRHDSRWRGRFSEITPDGMGAFLAAPVYYRDRVLGVLRVSRPRNTPSWFQARFTESDERILCAAGAQLGSALETQNAFDARLKNERMAAWGELSARSVHMVGNKTFAIKGHVNEIKYHVHTLPEEHQQPLGELTDSMEQSIYRLEDILTEFRDFLTATQLNPRKCSLNSLLHETAQECYLHHNNVHVHECYANDLPEIVADATRLKRALSELLENAVSFMPTGGTVRITTSLGLSRPGPGVTKSVIAEIYDTGAGVPAELKEQIFRPFFSTRSRGMGLGLSIVKGVVEAHGGEIREIGKLGSGALFQISLPAAVDEEVN